MMPIHVTADLWSLLPLTGAGLIFAAFGLGMFLIGWATGKNRGYQQAPEKYRTEYLDEQQKRLIAEGRLDAERRAGRKVESALNALTTQTELTETRQGLRVARG